MRGSRRLCTLTCLVLLAAGCASGGLRPEALQSWVGRPAAELQKEWGAPTREVEDGALRLLIYEELERQSRQSFEAQQATSTSRTYRDLAIAQAATEGARIPRVYVRSYLFWVNAERVIVRADVRQP